MNNYVACLVAFMAVCVMCVMSAPANREEESVQDLRYLKKFVDDLKVMIDNVDKMTNGEMSLAELTKRQGKQSGAWDMDYGWGGGRFGKRNGNSNGQAGAKRYDMYGMTGRFGRDVNRAEAQMRNSDH